MLQQSVEELYANHHGWLRGWLHRKLGNSGDAADLAHDTFLRVLRKAVKPSEAMPAFVPETIREPRAYLTTIANGLVVSHIRRRSLEQAWLETLASLPQPQFISPEQRAVVWQTLLDVDAALATLAPRVRQAFMMAQIDGRACRRPSPGQPSAARTIRAADARSAASSPPCCWRRPAGCSGSACHGGTGSAPISWPVRASVGMPRWKTAARSP